MIEFAAFGMLGLAVALNQRALSLTLRMGPESYEANPIARALLGRRKLHAVFRVVVYSWLGFWTWLLLPAPLPFSLLIPAIVLAAWSSDWANDEWQSRRKS